MSIYIWGYLKEYANEKAEIMEAITDVLESGKLILGSHVESFEKKFSAYCQASDGVGVANGTDAIFLALKALGIQEGDEVITVANTAVPTVSAIESTGARARFVDIDPVTYLMDVSKIESVITAKTKCILPVHLYGQCVEMNPIYDIAKKYNLKIIEDCAQAHGAKYFDRLAGGMSDLACFSFYPTKILGTYGDGGMVLASNNLYIEKLKRLRFYGMKDTYNAVEHGYNSRLDELHAAILLKKLTHLDDYIASRRSIAEKYNDELAMVAGLTLPYVSKNNFHSYYLYVCRHEKRDEIIQKLKQMDIFVNISYPWPIHTMEGYQHLGYKQGDLPHTEKAAKEIFSLPMYPTLSAEEQDKVILALKEILH